MRKTAMLSLALPIALTVACGDDEPKNDERPPAAKRVEKKRETSSRRERQPTPRQEEPGDGVVDVSGGVDVDSEKGVTGELDVRLEDKK